MSGNLDEVVGPADPALIVVTTAAEGVLAGCLVGFHSQASMDPERYCVWLSKANHTYRVAMRASHLAIHLLGVEDLALATRFGTLTGEDTDKFAGVDFELDDFGVPLLAACPRRLRLERVALLDDGGDHVCVTGKVLSAQGTGSFEPLRISAVGDLRPGHDNQERAIHP